MQQNNSSNELQQFETVSSKLIDPSAAFLAKLQSRFQAVHSDEVSNPWNFDPVPFTEFVTSKDHMRFPALSPRQLDAALSVLHSDPKKTFEAIDKLYDVVVCLWGKGSGKDSLAAMIVSYIVYVLLCLKNPYEFLTGYDVPDEPIDIVNVAYNYQQASNVFFTKLRSRVKNWSWLRRNFRVRESGKDLDPAANKKDFLNDKSATTITIYPSSIMFPNMIRAFSQHSMTESTEGLNVIAWIMDEASAMKDSTQKANADKLYEMLKTSAQSRFTNKWFGFILSFPRHKNDFTMRMVQDVVDGKLPRVYASKGATWEINPTKTYEDFREELENPKTKQDAEAKYACNPPAQESAFIEYTDKIQECVNKEKLQIVEFEKVHRRLETGATLLGKKISKFNISRQPDSKQYVARVDLGHVHDRGALAIGHLEGDRVVYDLVTHWQAEPNFPVDVDDPSNIIIELKRTLINIIYVTYDQWNSLSSMNKLHAHGIVAERLSLGYDDYKLFRDTIYGKKAEFVEYPLLTDPSIGELANLRLINGNKVDHDPGKHNDISEAVCGVTSMLLGTKKNVASVKSKEGHYEENENSADNTIWSTGNQYLEDRGDPFADGLSGVTAKLR